MTTHTSKESQNKEVSANLIYRNRKFLATLPISIRYEMNLIAKKDLINICSSESIDENSKSKIILIIFENIIENYQR